MKKPLLLTMHQNEDKPKFVEYIKISYLTDQPRPNQT